MHLRIIVVLVLLFSIHTFSVGAEGSDIMYVEYVTTSSAQNELMLLDNYSTPTEYKFDDIKAQFVVPLYKTASENPIYVSLMANYEYMSFDYGFMDIDLPLVSSIESLHSIGTSIGVYVPMENNLSMFFNLGGSFNTNLDKIDQIDQKDILTTGNIIFMNKYMNIDYQFGLTSASSFGKPMILPIAGVSFRPKDWMKVSILIPYQIDASFFYKKFTTGFYTRVIGNQYRLIRDDAANNYTLSITNVETGVKFRYNVWNKINIYSDLGTYVYRSLSVADDANNEVGKMSFSDKFDETLYLRIGVSFSAQ